MHIKKLTISHYRGASHLEVNLHPTLNVFCGANGSGKSTLLDAIAIMLSWTVSRMSHAGTSGRPIQEKDISNGQSVASIELVCEADNQSIDWKLVKSRKGHASVDERTVLSHLNDYTKQLQNQISVNNEQVNLPLFVYYPVNRTVVDIPLRIRGTHSFNLLAAYEDALISGANFRTFFEWFRQREDLENEIIRDQRRQLTSPEVMNELNEVLDFPNSETKVQFPDPQLEAVRSAIERLIPGFKNLTVRRNPLRMEVKKWKTVSGKSTL